MGCWDRYTQDNSEVLTFGLGVFRVEGYEGALDGVIGLVIRVV